MRSFVLPMYPGRTFGPIPPQAGEWANKSTTITNYIAAAGVPTAVSADTRSLDKAIKQSRLSNI